MRYTDVLGKRLRGTGTIGERVSELLPDIESLKRGVRDLRGKMESCGISPGATGRHGVLSGVAHAGEHLLERAGGVLGRHWTKDDRGRAEVAAVAPRTVHRVKHAAEDERDAHEDKGGIDVATGMLLAAGTALLGAGIMFFMDPARGRRRRHIARDKVKHTWRVIEDNARKAARDAAHRAQGLVAETKARFRDEEVPDDTLVARVRSAMGRVVSNPGAVVVDAHGGTVVLSGVILEDELEPLLTTVWGVRGVTEVENRLEPHAQSEGRPDLQGRRRPQRGGAGTLPPAARLGTGIAGGLLLGGGLARGGPLGLGLGLLGAGLTAQSALCLSTRRLVGRGGMRTRRAVDVQKTIRINAPIDRVFDFFALYENFPKFMSNIKEIRDLGSDRSRWIVRGPAGMDVEWEAVVTRFEPGRVLAWRSVEGSPIPNAGTIRFEELSEGATRVDIKLSYAPPGGTLGHAAAALFGADPKSEMDEDLMRAKVALETGKAAHDAQRPMEPQPVGHEAFEETRVNRPRNQGGGEGSASGND